MTLTESYSYIGDSLAVILPEYWSSAVLKFEKTGNSVGSTGYYVDSAGRKNQVAVGELPWEIDDAIDEIYLLTTAEESNRWNRLRYTLHADRTFEVDFIWDEDLAEEMAYINSTTTVPEPRRGAALSYLKQQQLERKTQRIYDALALAVLNNAPDGNEWQQLVLTLTQTPLAYEAQAERAPGRHEVLLLLGEAEAVEALVELTQQGNHLRWERVQLVVQPSGAYRFSFTWAGAGEYNLPPRYHREGQVTLPPTAG